MENEFKYWQYLKEFDNCPSTECKAINMQSFRLIFEDINHTDNFKPPLLIKPSRINEKMFDTNEQKCSGYALSLFNSLENARNRFINISKRNKCFGTNVGDHVAEIKIEEHEGKATEPSTNKNNFGHFDFFEYIDTNFFDKITRKKRIMI